jgi:hypothetical protein
LAAALAGMMDEQDRSASAALRQQPRLNRAEGVGLVLA